jgi:hypothetical protein
MFKLQVRLASIWLSSLQTSLFPLSRSRDAPSTTTIRDVASATAPSPLPSSILVTPRNHRREYDT